MAVAATGDFAAGRPVAAVAATPLDAAVPRAAGVGAVPSVAVSAGVESRSVVAAPRAAPWTPATSCGEPAGNAVPEGSAPAAALDVTVTEFDAPLDIAVLGVAAPAMPAMAAGAAASETSSLASPKPEGATGAPLAPRSSAGSVGTPIGAAEAGGVTLPDGGNISPPGLPVPALAESSFRFCLADTRLSAPAKSREPDALAAASEEAAAVCGFSCGGACRGAAATGVRIARVAAFMVHEVASDVPGGSTNLVFVLCFEH